MTQKRSMLKPRFELIVRQARSKILKRYPNILAIILSGSVSREQQLPNSDVDLLAITGGSHIPRPMVYYDQGNLVGIFFVSLRRFKEWDKDPKEFFWARGEALTAKVLYDTSGIVQKILRKRRTLKPSRRITEEIIYDSCFNILEYLGKLRNGSLVRDQYLTRYAARVVAQYAEKTLIALNDISPVSENEIWHQVRKARIKPSHLIPDYPIALGIKGTRLTRRVSLSALRLGRETIELVRNILEREAKNES